MRKLIIAASLISLLGLSAVAILSYREFILPVMENMDSFKEMAKLGAFNDRIANRARFTPPEDNVITQAQVDRFLAVQREVQEGAGASFDTVRTRLDLPADSLKNEPGSPWVHFSNQLGTYRGINPHMSRVKEEQVEALNRHDFSLSEYRWIRESLLRAMGRQSNFYVEDLGAPPDSGAGTPAAKSEPRVPPENVALVRAIADSLSPWFPISVLGF